MAKKKPSSDKELMDEQVRKVAKDYCYFNEITVEQAAKRLEVCRDTYDKKMKQPEKLTLKQLRLLAERFHASDEQILGMVRPEKERRIYGK